MSNTDTPTDHTVIALTIEAELLPEWFESVKDIAARLCRRMAVVERPEAWLVQIELPKERVGELSEALASAWGEFVAERKAQGRWEESPS